MWKFICNICSHHEIVEILLLKLVLNTNQSINQFHIYLPCITYIRYRIFSRFWCSFSVKVSHVATFGYIIFPHTFIHLSFCQVKEFTWTIFLVIFPRSFITIFIRWKVINIINVSQCCLKIISRIIKLKSMSRKKYFI